MSKTILRSNGISLAVAIMLLGSLFIISSCGGGGGGGGIAYDGLKTAATISSANANDIFASVWNMGVSSSGSVLAKSSSSNLKDSGIVGLAKQIRDRAMSGIVGSKPGSNKIMSEAIDYTDYDGLGGSMRITGNIDPNTMLGTMTMTFSNYNIDGTTMNGSVKFKVDGYDQTNAMITDGTITFTSWTVKDATTDISLSGSMRMQESITNPANTETMTINLTGRDNISKDTFRYENFVDVTTYDDITMPFAAMLTESVTGRVYVGEYGYVDISTTSPLTYDPMVQDHPSGGGPLILSNESGSISITPTPTDYTIYVDANADGTYECGPDTYAW